MYHLISPLALLHFKFNMVGPYLPFTMGLVACQVYYEKEGREGEKGRLSFLEIDKVLYIFSPIPLLFPSFLFFPPPSMAALYIEGHLAIHHLPRIGYISSTAVCK